MLICTDPSGFTISLAHPARRIISLVPSLTELLYDLGLEEEVCGISKFCIHPDHWFRSKTRVGGTKNPHLERIRLLEPDLIIANREENRKEDILALRTDIPVYTSEIASLEENKDAVLSIGKLTGRSSRAREIVMQIEGAVAAWQNEWQQIRSSSDFPFANNPSVVYLIWRQPYMSVGSDTYIHSLLQLAGFQNFMGESQRYPELDLQQLQSNPPDIVMLSSEPYPFKPLHHEEIQTLLPQSLIIPADGELFSWYGSRPLQILQGFRRLWTEILTKINER